MIQVRDVFQAKYGRGDELAALLKEANALGGDVYGPLRIMTDASGTFFTVVTEGDFESLGDWERRTAEVFGAPEFGAWFARMMELVETGRREFYHIQG